MTTVSGAPVSRVLRQAARQVKATVRQANQKAAKLVAKGDYGSADTLVVLARSIGEFGQEIAVMRERWTGLLARARPGRSDRTPLWEYYRPILRVLVEMGGRAGARDLERQFEVKCAPSLKTGDLASTPTGLPRWKAMVVRARVAMIKEGFLEPDKKKGWRITDAGKKAAGT